MTYQKSVKQQQKMKLKKVIENLREGTLPDRKSDQWILLSKNQQNVLIPCYSGEKPRSIGNIQDKLAKIKSINDFIQVVKNNDIIQFISVFIDI